MLKAFLFWLKIKFMSTNGLTGRVRKEKMEFEFDTLVEFFSSLAYAKSSYPTSATYIKHLKKTSIDKAKEVEQFKRFLVDNQAIAEKKLTSPYFKTGKASVTLAMNEFIIPGHVDTFWDNIVKVERTLFPDGKPAKMEVAAGITGAMAAFQDNPIMADVIEQVKTMGDFDDITDVNALMAKPAFKKMVNNIKTNLLTGKYSIKDLTGTVASVIGSVQHELDDETKNTLKVVTDTMGAVERNEPVDINNLMSMVNDLKLDNIGK